MNQFGVILALIFSLIIAIFAIANQHPIIINYLYGRTEVSAIVVILGAAILGALVIFMINLVKNIRTRLQLRSLRSEINQLKEKLHGIEKERDALLAQVGQLQEEALAVEGEKEASGEAAAGESHPPPVERTTEQKQDTAESAVDESAEQEEIKEKIAGEEEHSAGEEEVLEAEAETEKREDRER